MATELDVTKDETKDIYIRLINDKEFFLQKIATICGGYSLGGLGGMQFKAFYKSPFEPDGRDICHIVEPYKVEGVYQAIFQRLINTIEYDPIKAIEYERNNLASELGKKNEEIRQLNNKIATLERNIIRLVKYAVNQGKENFSKYYDEIKHFLEVYGL